MNKNTYTIQKWIINIDSKITITIICIKINKIFYKFKII